jgi:Uma2 family endonuclease
MCGVFDHSLGKSVGFSAAQPEGFAPTITIEITRPGFVMTQALPQKLRAASVSTAVESVLTFEAFLAYDDGDGDRPYELENGVLREMPVESPGNDSIAKWLMFELAKHVPIALLSNRTEVEVSGRRATCRIPDLLVHSEASYQALAGAKRNLLTRDMPPPALVVEVVSPGEDNRNRDYRYKRTEYGARGIAEYWIVDPAEQRVTVCRWVEGQYEDEVFRGSDRLVSIVIPASELMAEQVLAFGVNAL